MSAAPSEPILKAGTNGLIPNPFDEVVPHPLAQAAAQALMARLPPLDEGKMFGVLVHEAGVLEAFSGDSPLQGFVPHLYDAAARAEIEPASDVIVKALGARIENAAEKLAERDELKTALEAERTALKALHAERKRLRHLGPGDDEQSRADGRARRQFEARAKEALAAFAPFERHHAALERLRRIVSQEAMRRIHDTYRLENVLGEVTTLRSLFDGKEPPWGAGECAAVKLVAHAVRLRLRPVALAEFWWGPPPSGGARVHGAFYPACATRCLPVLPFLMRGWNVASRRAWSSQPQGALETLFADAHLAVLSKPAGLLSVPGKSDADSVLAQVREQHCGAKLVHRLDLDTSGVLLVALDDETYRALQAQFIARTVVKRYVAWLQGEVKNDSGVIELPMRVDLEQRPRQIVDFTHGKQAITRFEVLKREAGRTQVAFFPATGRTHQLRVHAAHEKGLGAPIVGDRLYGQDGERLALHAEALSFTHPHTGERLTFTVPVPF